MTDLNQAEVHPGQIVQEFLAACPEKLIRVAGTGDLRAALTEITGYMCRRAVKDISGFHCFGGRCDRPLGVVCEAGNAMRAGFELQHEISKAVAGDYLAAAGFSPALAMADPGYHAAVVEPAVAGAGRSRLRLALASVVTRVREVSADVAGSGGYFPPAAEIPAGLQVEADCLHAAVSLYGCVALTESAHVLYGIFISLDPALVPPAPGPGQ